MEHLRRCTNGACSLCNSAFAPRFFLLVASGVQHVNAASIAALDAADGVMDGKYFGAQIAAQGACTPSLHSILARGCYYAFLLCFLFSSLCCFFR